MQVALQYSASPKHSSAAFQFLMVVLVGMLGLSLSQPLYGQDTKSETETETVAQLRESYESSVDKLRTTLKGLRRAEALYLFSSSEESHEHKEEWDELATQSETLFEEIREKAYALFWAMDQPDDDLILVVRNLTTGSINQGKLGLAHRNAQKLAELKPEHEGLAEELMRIEIFNNKFDAAVKFKPANADKIEEYDRKEQALFEYIEELKTNFDRELKLREKDKNANLPRVEMNIKGKGKVIIELFEDEAPETVANFISLVEAGFYDGTIFHHAIKSYLIHGGLMSMNKFEPTGYTIYDECTKPERRHHFRGSISMWTSTDEPNSCGAEFSILRMPGPYFTKSNHTVFGRVIQGMDIVDEIENTRTLNEEDGSETTILDIVPDTIESMKVIRKRDHDYEPNPVK